MEKPYLARNKPYIIIAIFFAVLDTIAWWLTTIDAIPFLTFWVFLFVVQIVAVSVALLVKRRETKKQSINSNL